MKKNFLTAVAALSVASATFAQNGWMMNIHMKSGELKTIPCEDVDKITFSKGNSQLYADVAATDSYNLYYGAVSSELGMYMIHLCDGKLTTGGLPTEINRHDIRLTVMAKPSADSDNASLETGTYTLTDNPNERGVFGKQSVYIETNTVNAAGKVDGFLDSLKVCTLDVENRGDGTYRLEMNGELDECGPIRFVYDGKLEFVNKDKNTGYDYITSDVNFMPAAMSGRYVRATDKYCDYSIAFYNCAIDDEGFVSGAGGLLNLVLLTPYAVPMDISTIAGTYDVVMPVSGAKYEAGKFIGGTMYETSYGTLPMGSYYEELDDEGYAKAYGMFCGGTVTVTNSLGELTFNCNWLTPQGHTVVMNYMGNASAIEDQSESDASYSAKTAVKTSVKGIACADLKAALYSRIMGDTTVPVILMKR